MDRCTGDASEGVRGNVQQPRQRIFTGLLNQLYDSCRKHPFFYFFLVGLSGSIFIDSDHLVSKALGMSRPFHLPILILVGCILCYSYAHCNRCFHKSMLKEMNNE